MDNMHLDVKDKKIIYSLSKNARLSANELARKVNVSKDVANYRLKKLTKDKIISKFITLINTEKLGYTRYELYIQLRNTKNRLAIINFLVNHDMFLWVRSALGDYEILTEFYVKDIHDFEEIVNDIRNNYSNDISCIDSAIVLKENAYPLKCIGFVEEEKIEKIETKTKSIDEKDMKILSIIADDARVQIIDIARQLKLGSDAIIYRIKNMKKSRIISGYRISVNEQLLGYGKYKLLLKLKNVDEKTHNMLLTFLKQENSVEYVKKCLNSWDYSITIIAKDVTDFKNLIFKIKDLLGEILISYKILLLFEEHKNTYYPKGINLKS
jgi:Lrp/AsnC family transcriptional regulator, leucine-responsive regulatory protein